MGNLEKQSGRKILSVALLILAIFYIIMPYDYDGSIVGLTDDFCFFMAAFCYMMSQFKSKHKQAENLLKKIAILFLAVGVIVLFIFAFTPLLYSVA